MSSLLCEVLQHTRCMVTEVRGERASDRTDLRSFESLNSFLVVAMQHLRAVPLSRSHCDRHVLTTFHN